MKKLLVLTAGIALLSFQNIMAQKVTTVAAFEKVIISPHIQATLAKGDQESVTVLSSTVSEDKIHIESNGKTLRVYLEGAKEVTKNEKKNDEGVKKSLYTGTVLKIAVSYKTLQELSVRGEETIGLNSKVDQENFNLIMYGTPEVTLSDMKLKTMNTTIYGEGSLDIKSGTVNEQRFTSYGKSTVNALGLKSTLSKATLYGEGELKLSVSEQLRVTAFGGGNIGYKGTPEIKKGINIGNLKIYKID